MKNIAKLRVLSASLFFAAAASAVMGRGSFHSVARFQPGPLISGAASGVSFAFILPLMVIAASAMLGGRIFCSFVCPFGFMQDCAKFMFCRKRPYSRDKKLFKYVRLAVLAVSMGALVCGSALFFGLFDPFSNFGRVSAGVVNSISLLLAGAPHAQIIPWASGFLCAIILLTASVAVMPRFFCRVLCPVGALLGLLSAKSVWNIGMNESCVKCGACEKVCPAGCIRADIMQVDSSLCIRCMKCIYSCPTGSMSYKSRFAQAARDDVPAYPARRAMLIAGGIAAAGAAAAFGIRKVPFGSAMIPQAEDEKTILPPGAGSSRAFLSRCTGCQVCAVSCPTNVIKPSLYLVGPVHLDYTHTSCSMNCVKCSSVCPSGALLPVTLNEKRNLKIGEAFCDIGKCRAAAEGVPCYICSKICPKGAIFMREYKNGLEVPEVMAFHCIGCGACQSVCPMSPKAITVHPVVQRQIGN